MDDTRVLVTGGSGYVASWIIKYLLEQGYSVNTTVRDKKKYENYKHLTAIAEKSEGNLMIFEADLLQNGSFADAMKGCTHVIHTASPFFISGIKDAQKQLVEPALMGTRNVLNTANKTASVSKVVLTSSIAAVIGDNIEMNEVENGVLTEKNWNKTSTAKHQAYYYSKTIAEKVAWEINKSQNQWKLVVINPGFVLGPSLTKRVDSTSIDFMRNILRGKFKFGIPALSFGIVDVRDIAKAHINAAFLTDAQGRHLCVSKVLWALEISNILKSKFNNAYKFPNKQLPKFLLYLFGPAMGLSWKTINRNIGYPLSIDNSYAREDLRIDFIDIETTLIDHANQLINDGLI